MDELLEYVRGFYADMSELTHEQRMDGDSESLTYRKARAAEDLFGLLYDNIGDDALFGEDDLIIN